MNSYIYEGVINTPHTILKDVITDKLFLFIAFYFYYYYLFKQNLRFQNDSRKH